MLRAPFSAGLALSSCLVGKVEPGPLFSPLPDCEDALAFLAVAKRVLWDELPCRPFSFSSQDVPLEMRWNLMLIGFTQIAPFPILAVPRALKQRLFYFQLVIRS